jgi:AAA domain
VSTHFSYSEDPTGLKAKYAAQQETALWHEAKNKAESEKHAAQIVAVAGDAIMRMNIPEREVLMAEGVHPLFYAQSLNQILAWRGIGKTLFGLGIAGAMTAGDSILGFKASRAMKVMYVDGELPLAQLKERIGLLIKRPENFHAVNAELCAHQVSNRSQAREDLVDDAGRDR